MEKLVILGGGVSGLSAAIYAARAHMEPIVVTGFEDGGQLTTTTTVENFPGFPEGVMGPKLVQDMKTQAERFGARFKLGRIISMKALKTGVELQTDEETIKAETVIIATGATAKWLNIPSEERFRGRGVHTCATCDGFFYKGKDIMVVGGGDTACEESNYLAKIANSVTILLRGDTMRASQIMQGHVKENPKIKVMWNSSIAEFKGDKQVSSVMIKDSKTGAVKEHKTDGVFLAIGHTPNTDFCRGVVDLDEEGYIRTDERRRTNVPGVFASGDVQDTRYRQAITAAGTGCQAALEAQRYHASLGHKH